MKTTQDTATEGTAKLLAYAYPTSTNAALLGFAKTGCWYVGNRGFATRAEAVAFGDSLPGVWGYWSMTNPIFTHEADAFNQPEETD